MKHSDFGISANLRLILMALTAVSVIWLAVPHTAVSPAAAQSAQTAGKKAKDVDIEADQMRVIEEEFKAVFTGKVDAKRDDMTLNSDELVVHYEEKQQEDGSKKTEITRLEASGNVVIVTPTQKITGDWAKMNVGTNKATVGGNVVVEQQGSIVRGNELRVDLDRDISQMRGGRVKGTFSSSN